MSHSRCWLTVVALALATDLSAQGNVTRRDTAMINRSSNPLLANFRYRSIGPASMGGRIDDVAVYEKDPRIIWIGYAVGGIYKSTNAGTTFTPVFEKYGSASIGDIALDQNNPNIAYVGTGEPNNRQTSSFGDGMYKTTDGGKTFTHIGLRETQTSRAWCSTRNSNRLRVRLVIYSRLTPIAHYKSTDGGRSDEGQIRRQNTALDPQSTTNPNVLYAASYQRRTGCCWRRAGRLVEERRRRPHWTKLTGAAFRREPTGRIAVDVARSTPMLARSRNRRR
jgi:hypothetical protein